MMSTALSVFCSLTLIASLVVPAFGNKDSDALMALRQSLSDLNHALDSWDPSMTDPCTWYHITCNNANRVIRIDLAGLNLGGALVPQLGNLDTLQHLELYENNIHGSIPSELGDLKNLLSLDLNNNNISGIIPPSLRNLKQLVILRLNDNPLLSGIIPADFSDLKILNVSNTQVIGPPPPPPPSPIS